MNDALSQNIQSAILYLTGLLFVGLRIMKN